MKNGMNFNIILKENRVFVESKKYLIEINDTCENIIELNDIDFFNDRIYIKTESKIVNVFHWYEILEFDISQLGNSKYTNAKLFSPGARRYIKNEGIIVVVGLLLAKVRFYDFYPGLITLLTYKITESYSDFSSLENVIVEERLALTDQNSLSSNDSVRWRVSSGFVVAVYLYSKQRYSDIKLLNDEIISYEKHLNKAPIISQNYYSFRLIYALSCMQLSDYINVIKTTKCIFDGCQSALMNLVNCKNRSFISQSKDAHVIVDIANNSAILHSAMRTVSACEVDSKECIDFRYAPRVNFDINKIIFRFGPDLKNDHHFITTDELVNNIYKGKT